MYYLTMSTFRWPQYPAVQSIVQTIRINKHLFYSTPAGLAQSVKCFTVDQEVVGLIPGAGPILRILK